MLWLEMQIQPNCTVCGLNMKELRVIHSFFFNSLKKPHHLQNIFLPNKIERALMNKNIV